MIPQYLMATGPSLNISLCQKIFFIYRGNRTIAKYIAVSKNIFYLWWQPDHRLLYRCVKKYFLSMAATGPSLNISLRQKIFFIYGGNRTIAKYIAASKKIFINMALVTLTALDSLMAILAVFNHRESERTWACPISDSLRPIS